MITLLSGTNRPDSNTRKVVGELLRLYRELGEPTALIDLAQLPSGVFEPASYEEKPAAFAPFADAVLASSGLVVVTPEYNGGIPGVLKYFIDLLPFPESFEKRPVCFVGLAAGIWGALRPVEQLQAIFGYRNAFIFPERVFLPGVGRLLDGEGRVTNADLKERLRDQATGFIEFVRRMRAARSASNS